jgi:hypothetical protein
MFVSIELELRKENKKLKDYMNKETLDIFDQYLNGGKQIIMAKARRTGASGSVTSSLMNWKNLYEKHERRKLRKESIKRIFNI